MDQIKIGKFIAEKRKEKKLTQSILAEKLGISDRAISKWENGKCMPDVGIMQDICKLLNITINDLFSGEIVDMKNNEKKLEENLLEVAKMKEKSDKQLLFSEIVIGFIITILLSVSIFLLGGSDNNNKPLIMFGICTLVIFVLGILYCLKLQREAGFYECKKCHHKYEPTFMQIFNAPHIGITKYMKCPECHKRSWNKKTIEK